ncbi:NfeD family protein [Kovacikia minuta CCNUW1]|uniref:NfeD family protein n=1 Tax=Kovacikia minuta TaxID=2931930 RepID=UPI001CD0100B|nr:NfeD family protein [Kovacikia minuta]UBF26639.1 NfeD family protein [Kovacikia minuta CCNUW1]
MALNPTLIWLLLGIGLCLIEFIVPTAFVASVMGISALIVAPLAHLIPFSLQILLWMMLSLVLVLLSRRFVRQKAAKKLDATEAETLTEIPPGKSGRVLYEGNSWAARCEDHTLAIAPHQKVYVTGRQGTTLIVMPESLIHS